MDFQLYFLIVCLRSLRSQAPTGLRHSIRKRQSLPIQAYGQFVLIVSKYFLIFKFQFLIYQVCFSQFKIVKKPFNEYIDGCKWIFSSEIYMFRDLICPVWLYFVQFFTTLSLVLTFGILAAIIFSLFNRIGKKFCFVYILTIALAFKGN